MPSVKIDTTKTKEAGKDIITLTKELKEELDLLFRRISNVPVTTREWIGPAANEYVRRTNLEKIAYNLIISDLNKYGKALVNAADRYDASLKKIW